MARCRVDKSIERVTMDGFAFPLGVYPVEPMHPREGYLVDFEPADTGDDEEFEQWPDRYVFDIVITATRLEALCRPLLAMLPGRVYPILDVLGNDAYREIDPYIGYELVSSERFIDALRRFRAYFHEDGLVGFGAMSEEPFLYVFVDEHKIVTVRAETELKERVERILKAFDLEETDRAAGADSAVHEHRTVLEAPADRPDLLNADEIVEVLRDDWGLVLNLDHATNVDDDGTDLGVTGWRCVVRLAEDDRLKYAESLLTAGSLGRAEELALEATRALLPADAEHPADALVVIAADRMEPDAFRDAVRAVGGTPPADGPLAEEAASVTHWLD